MNNLSNSIYTYYRSHFDELPFDKQLHFASRLYLWSGDAFAREQLMRLRPQVSSQDTPENALQAVFDEASATIHHGSKNASELRAPYFEKYPLLRSVAMVLFRYTFLKTIYGLDARDKLFELFPGETIESLLTQLFADDRAVAVLSTHAINVQYLYTRVVLEQDTAFSPEAMLAIGASQYDFTDRVELQLYIYLYTHCIIGESQFYARPIPEKYRPVYQQMLLELENVIGGSFEQVNLDNKFEYLVCCRMLGMTSVLEDRIWAEAERSLSPDGTWIVDRENANPQVANATFDRSEHRNVLCIMAGTPMLVTGRDSL
jgi:hypothetical protein